MYLNLTPKCELHKYNIKYVHGSWLRLTDSTEHEPTAGQQMNKKPLILIWEKQLGYLQFLNIFLYQPFIIYIVRWTTSASYKVDPTISFDYTFYSKLVTVIILLLRTLWLSYFLRVFCLVCRLHRRTVLTDYKLLHNFPQLTSKLESVWRDGVMVSTTACACVKTNSMAHFGIYEPIFSVFVS